MNARPYILGCLCLVGANGTAAASDTSLTEALLSSLSRSVSSSFESSSSHASQGGHDGGGDVTSPRQLNSSPQPAPNPSPVPAPVDSDADARDGSSGNRSPAPNWQSLLPGSIF